MDVGGAVRSRPVIHGNIDYTGSKYSSGEQQLEVAERVEVAEVFPPSDEPLVVAPREELRAAQAVADRDVKDKAQHLGEEDVAEMVEQSHRLPFHRIHEP